MNEQQLFRYNVHRTYHTLCQVLLFLVTIPACAMCRSHRALIIAIVTEITNGQTFTRLNAPQIARITITTTGRRTVAVRLTIARPTVGHHTMAGRILYVGFVAFAVIGPNAASTLRRAILAGRYATFAEWNNAEVLVV